MGIKRSIIKYMPEVIKRPLIKSRKIIISCKSKDPSAIRIGGWIYGNLPRLYLIDIFPGIEKVDVTIEKLFDRLIGRSLDAYEITIISAITKFLKPKNILEIGTWDGNTALNLAVNSPSDARITTLDLPLDFVKGKSKTKLDTNHLNITSRIKVGIQYKNTIYEKKINQVYGDSADIDWNTLRGPFDLIFIDGCHTYAYVKSDTENALRYLKSNGIIVWHDYGQIKDVSNLVDETAEKIEVKAIQGTRFAVGYKTHI